MLAFLQLAQHTVKEIAKRPDSSADLLFWIVIALGTAITGLATFYVAQLKAWRDERERVKLKYEQLLKDAKVACEMSRREDLLAWHKEKEALLQAQATERVGFRERENQLVEAKDEVYRGQVDMLNGFLNEAKEG